MKFESIVLAEEISAILKENQRDQEVVLSSNIQLLLHQTQAIRPGDVHQPKSIQNSCRIYPEIDPDFHQIIIITFESEFVFDIRSGIQLDFNSTYLIQVLLLF